MTSAAFAAESLGGICWSLHQVVVLLGIPSGGHHACLTRGCGGNKIAACCELWPEYKAGVGSRQERIKDLGKPYRVVSQLHSIPRSVLLMKKETRDLPSASRSYCPLPSPPSSEIDTDCQPSRNFFRHRNLRQ